MHLKRTVNIQEFLKLFKGPDAVLAVEALVKHEEMHFENFIFVPNVGTIEWPKI